MKQHNAQDCDIWEKGSEGNEWGELYHYKINFCVVTQAMNLWWNLAISLSKITEIEVQGDWNSWNFGAKDSRCGRLHRKNSGNVNKGLHGSLAEASAHVQGET